jgi:DeoR family transcriptional regulator of aga operon
MGMKGDFILGKSNVRRDWIMQQMRDKGSIQVSEIVDKFTISEVTVRRDLELLENEKKCIRTLGGAILESMKTEIPFFKKLEILADEKREIADKAIALIREDDVIALTGGTTNYFIAKKLNQFSKLTVITNALNIAFELIGMPGLQLIVTGGVIHTQSYELAGPLAESTLERLNIQKTFVGVDGISLTKGITMFNHVEAQIDQIMMKRSLQTYVVADHTKFNTSALYVVSDLKLITGIITDTAISPDIVRRYRESGISFF